MSMRVIIAAFALLCVVYATAEESADAITIEKDVQVIPESEFALDDEQHAVAEATAPSKARSELSQLDAQKQSGEKAPFAYAVSGNGFIAVGGGVSVTTAAATAGLLPKFTHMSTISGGTWFRTLFDFDMDLYKLVVSGHARSAMEYIVRKSRGGSLDMALTSSVCSTTKAVLDWWEKAFDTSKWMLMSNSNLMPTAWVTSVECMFSGFHRAFKGLDSDRTPAALQMTRLDCMTLPPDVWTQAVNGRHTVHVKTSLKLKTNGPSYNKHNLLVPVAFRRGTNSNLNQWVYGTHIRDFETEGIVDGKPETHRVKLGEPSVLTTTAISSAAFGPLSLPMMQTQHQKTSLQGKPVMSNMAPDIQGEVSSSDFRARSYRGIDGAFTDNIGLAFAIAAMQKDHPDAPLYRAIAVENGMVDGSDFEHYFGAVPHTHAGCTSMTFATGNGQWDASGKVEVFTKGAWSPLPSACTDKGSTCQYNVCADSLKIKVGNDGWKTTATANGKVVNDASEFIKKEEVAYTLPGATVMSELMKAASTASGKAFFSTGPGENIEVPRPRIFEEAFPSGDKWQTENDHLTGLVVKWWRGKVTTVENKWYGVKAGRKVDLLMWMRKVDASLLLGETRDKALKLINMAGNEAMTARKVFGAYKNCFNKVGDMQCMVDLDLPKKLAKEAEKKQRGLTEKHQQHVAELHKTVEEKQRELTENHQQHFAKISAIWHCHDKIQHCWLHKKNGGCKSGNAHHHMWRTNCVKTCGYCTDSRYNRG
jgi:hypothetical protein